MTTFDVYPVKVAVIDVRKEDNEKFLLVTAGLSLHELGILKIVDTGNVKATGKESTISHEVEFPAWEIHEITTGNLGKLREILVKEGNISMTVAASGTTRLKARNVIESGFYVEASRKIARSNDWAREIIDL
jgi:hypothetical protein